MDPSDRTLADERQAVIDYLCREVPTMDDHYFKLLERILRWRNHRQERGAEPFMYSVDCRHVLERSPTSGLVVYHLGEIRRDDNFPFRWGDFLGRLFDDFLIGGPEYLDPGGKVIIKKRGITQRPPSMSFWHREEGREDQLLAEVTIAELNEFRKRLGRFMVTEYDYE